MTDHDHAHLFRNRHRLGRAELSWAARRAAMVDAHHVAKVHQRFGVIDGFEISAAGGTGGPLIVGAGTAYTRCGDLVRVDCETRFPPPSGPGTHQVLLDPTGRVQLLPADGCRSGDALYLGSASATVWSSHLPDHIRWVTTSTSTSGRLLAAHRRRAHVAAGVEEVSLRDVEIDIDDRTVSRRVITSNGRFERTPLYFASIRFLFNDSDPVAWINGGWLVDICAPAPTAFTLRLLVHFDDEVALLQERKASGPDMPLVITWLGVDPDRHEFDHADHSCGPLPTPPQPPVIS